MNTPTIKTQTADLTAFIALKNAEKTANDSATRALDLIRIAAIDDAPVAASKAAQARSEAISAQRAWMKTPPARRALAAKSAGSMKDLLDAFFQGYCGEYSGDTLHLMSWWTHAFARTTVSRGEAYSRSSKYWKTNATHEITLDPAGVPYLVANPAIASVSLSEDMPLIALYPDGRAVWITASGKRIDSQDGWIAAQSGMIYHSTVSLDHAKKGLQRKIDAAAKQAREDAHNRKIERRARLVARLCGGAVATISDARRMGYCEPGIKAFQSRHGIGDAASLPDLVRSGNPLAAKLAVTLARTITR
jgi:hypothetical protein